MLIHQVDEADAQLRRVGDLQSIGVRRREVSSSRLVAKNDVPHRASKPRASTRRVTGKNGR